MVTERNDQSEARFAGVSDWRILLVDDEPTQRLIMARLLKRAGYDVQTAANGREALKAVHEGDFHFVITDWEMPEMDGIALCSALRARRKGSYIFTIILCARDAIEHVVTGLQAGADDYLTKPVIEPELMARLNTGKRIVELERSLRVAISDNLRLAFRHPVTEARNRLYLMKKLPIELRRAGRQGTPLSVLMCDIDNFKSVNDAHGHAAGGNVLTAVARFLETQARQVGGWSVHHGGDEFALVLRDTAIRAATTFAEAARERLSEQSISVQGAELRVTASFGVSGWENAVPEYAMTEDLLRIADACVYESKFAGRNRVSVRSMASSG